MSLCYFTYFVAAQHMHSEVRRHFDTMIVTDYALIERSVCIQNFLRKQNNVCILVIDDLSLANGLSSAVLYL